MKLFTVDEANELLPDITPMLKDVKRLYAATEAYRESARSAAAVSTLGGGMAGGARYVKALYEIGKLTTQLHEMGVQVKDPTRGLIDLPSLRDGRVVLLCWQLGEAEFFEWWHDVDAGFAGRQPL